MNDSPGSLELLSLRVDELEQRVHALEHPDEAKSAAVLMRANAASAVTSTEASVFQAGNLFPTLGRAMLGVAGAYALRAVAAAGAIPKGAVAAAAITYAFAWLVWAVRVSKISGLLSLVYAGTSALILAPMLWELTLHFQVFAPASTAGILAAFVTAASVLTWNRDAQQVLWVTCSTTGLTAVALSVAAHEMLPFLLVLLVMALLCELQRMLGSPRALWPLIALMTDSAIWGINFIYSGPSNARADYPSLSPIALIFPAILLFAIYGTSVAVRVMMRGCTITVLETIQATIAFLLAVAAISYFAPVQGTAMVGSLCLILAISGYWASFRYLRSRPVVRDFRVFGAWSAALLLGGMLWISPLAIASMSMAIAALAFYAIAARINSRMLQLHGALFLVSSTAISTLPQYVFGAIAGAPPNEPTLRIFIVAGCATAAYVISGDCPSKQWQHQVLCLIPALVAACGLAALMIHGLLALAALAIAPDVYHIAFLRTLVLSAISMCFAFLGSRWERVAMRRLAYFALMFVAAKLFFEDLRHGHMEFIAASIFLFAITLIAVPRLVRAGTKMRAAPSIEPASSSGTAVLH